METLKRPACIGSATLSQLAFSGEGNPNFRREKSHWDNQLYTVKKKRKKKKIKVELIRVILSAPNIEDFCSYFQKNIYPFVSS